MSRDEMLWALRDDRTLSTKAKIVWVMLLTRGENCRPAIPTIAADCGLSKSTTRRAIGELAEAGWLKVSAAVTPEGDSDTNSYLVVSPGHRGVVSQPDHPSSDMARSGGGGVTAGPRGGVTAGGGGVTAGPEDKPSLETTSVKEKSVRPPASAGGVTRLDVKRLCTKLADRIEANGSKRPAITKTWLDAARLLLDSDKRTEAQVSKAIDWCQNDEFWRRNIMSMPTLRKQYDRMRLQAQAEQRSGAAPKPGEDGWVQPVSPFRGMS
jgi:hypothetical protein